jgi:tRNA U34 5-methylaminomethyl-2-thiouridine-forming methyltransferase MnmC
LIVLTHGSGDLARQTADGSWTLAHPEHSEWYHSMAGALTEARHLYVVASGIRSEFERGSGVRVVDVGLGLGYNALATVDAWLQSGAKAHLQILSLENDEALFHALRSGDAPWQISWNPFWIEALKGLRRESPNLWRGVIQGPGGGELDWRVILGDARSDASISLLQTSGPYDYVWQDPFSPKKNPNMWAAEWFSVLGLVVACNGCLMTYSVARKVRDALEISGWQVEKIPTTSHKKNWLRAFRLARVGDPT